MDKSWMNANRTTKDFQTGLKAFIEYAKQFANSEGVIHCPCKSCRNVCLFKPNKVYAHIFDSGMQPDYTTWTYHGESRKRFCSESGDDDMAPILNDVLDNEVEELSVDNDRDDSPTELISKLHEDLYPGCKQSSTLKFTAELMQIKDHFKWSNESVDDLLKKLNEVLPEGSNLPKSFDEGERLLKWVKTALPDTPMPEIHIPHPPPFSADTSHDDIDDDHFDDL